MKNNKYFFFWKSKSPFSNWYLETYTVIKQTEVGAESSYQLTFNCSEMAMMYEKAMLFGDIITAGKILKEQNPRKQKALGREVKNFNKEIWEEKREEIVYRVLKDKFLNGSQRIKNYLKNTAGLILVEASPYDDVWGIGMAEDEPGVYDEENWKGLNLLGKLLTKLRIELYGE